MRNELWADTAAFQVLRSLSRWKSPSGPEVQHSQLSRASIKMWAWKRPGFPRHGRRKRDNVDLNVKQHAGESCIWPKADANWLVHSLWLHLCAKMHFTVRCLKSDLNRKSDHIFSKKHIRVEKDSETQSFHVVPVPVCGLVFHSETSDNLQSVKREVIKWH